MNIKFKRDVTLAPFTSFKVGGASHYFFSAHNQDDLEEAIQYAFRRGLRFISLAGGTNFLVADEGVPFLVIQPALFGIHKLPNGNISVGAGVLVADMLDFLVQNSLGGLEWAGGLPGTVGGALWGNAGAFGGEFKDSVVCVKSLVCDEQGVRIVTRTQRDCKFSYRTSIFKEQAKKEIIIEGVFHFALSDKKFLYKAVNEKIKYRNDHHPMEYPNAGSIFKNINAYMAPQNLFEQAMLQGKVKGEGMKAKIPTAFVIESLGLSGYCIGEAQVSRKHANFIINRGGARARDIYNLISHIKNVVATKLHIDLEEEIQYLGF